ncbi:hypothetical protein RCR19_06460 [Streptomyces sp. WAC07094]|uniref:hypothetical protein n=1 Tax=Streptomyces sp. WAC07094 TaxID=3072183 RepID=UPI002EB6B09E|nr:hypothetical protein [Streptomyces sp. WAC07094]
MTPHLPDGHSDPAATGVSLAAEAALLEGRLRMLPEAIDTVDARIATISDALRQPRSTSSASSEASRTVAIMGVTTFG